MNGINEEQEFLLSLQRVINDLDTIDEMEMNISNLQSQVDSEISDYVHIIENYGPTLTDKTKIKIFDRLAELRNIRRCRNNNHELVKYFKDHAGKLNLPNNRAILRQELSNKVKQLHYNYKYRVLTEEQVNELLKLDIAQKTESEQKTIKHKGISKDELEKCLNDNMSVKDIAEKYNKQQSYISHLKKKYGLDMRVYKKRG